MCGFAGFVTAQQSSHSGEILRQMASLIAHRGPDDDGFFQDGPVGLAFRRLAILDLSPAGHQPMRSADGVHTIAFNGEIYNYIELRTTLKALGHTFTSNGDTAVLLAAYREWGAGMLDRLNGMFAFVIHDSHRQLVFGARDRFGVKPLYHMQTPDGHFFGSEIKVFRAVQPLEYDGQQLAMLAGVGRTDLIPASERTFFKGVEEIRPGEAFEIGFDGDLKKWKWWDLDAAVRAEGETSDAPAAFWALFESAIALRLRADVPVGVMLSGGLDSTAVICAMAAHRRASGEPLNALHAFSHHDPHFDERAYIEDTATWTGAHVHSPEPMQSGEILDNLNKMLWAHDEPVHSPAAFIGYRLYELARARGVKVVLGGQGADEILGGYTSYYPAFLNEMLLRGKLGTLRREATAISRIGFPTPGMTQIARRVVSNGLRHIAPLHALLVAGRSPRLPLWSSRVAAHEAVARTQMNAPEPFTLRGVLQNGLQSLPLPLYLRIEDRNSMAHGVESRLPFMDYRIVSFAFGCPATDKIANARTKVLLRDSARGRIPQSVSDRTDKMGFPVDARSWFQGALREPTLDLLNSERTRSRELYNVAGLQHSLARGGDLSSSEAEALFQFLQIETWLGTPEKSVP